MLLKKVRVALGLDRCEILLTGAAPIHRDVLEYFMSVNMPVLELYGMSECAGPQTSNTLNHWRLGSVGPVMTGVKIRIDNPDENGDGEVCVCVCVCVCACVRACVRVWMSDLIQLHDYYTFNRSVSMVAMCSWVI